LATAEIRASSGDWLPPKDCFTVWVTVWISPKGADGIEQHGNQESNNNTLHGLVLNGIQKEVRIEHKNPLSYGETEF